MRSGQTLGRGMPRLMLLLASTALVVAGCGSGGTGGASGELSKDAYAAKINGMLSAYVSTQQAIEAASTTSDLQGALTRAHSQLVTMGQEAGSLKAPKDIAEHNAGLARAFSAYAVDIAKLEAEISANAPHDQTLQTGGAMSEDRGLIDDIVCEISATGYNVRPLGSCN